MITLLPESERSRVRIEYRLRLSTIAALLSAGVLLVCAGALLPSHFAASIAQRAAAREAAFVSQTVESSALKEAGESVRASQALLAAMKGFEAPRPSAALTEFLKQRPSGVTVTRIEYSRAETGATVRLSGIAQTREKLLTFRQSLKAIPGVANADVPLENLAKAADITFVLTVRFNAEP